VPLGSLPDKMRWMVCWPPTVYKVNPPSTLTKITAIARCRSEDQRMVNANTNAAPRICTKQGRVLPWSRDAS